MNLSKIIIPEHLVAQNPLKQRDLCKLLVIKKSDGIIEHKSFKDILGYFKKGDLLVLNNTKVFNARISARKLSGGLIEVFLLKAESQTLWHSLIKGRNIKKDLKIVVEGLDTPLTVVEKYSDGTYLVEFSDNTNVEKFLTEYGAVPLPPYIKRKANEDDKVYYQTVFAKEAGSVAAPTASLHFTSDLLRKIQELGVDIAFITLDVGYGTFSVVRDPENHVMHKESYRVDLSLERLVNLCKEKGNSVWAVGTTVVRTLESAFNSNLKLTRPVGETDLFIRKGYSFKIVDKLLTNFHHPETTLIYLTSTFAGEKNIINAYSEAIRLEYRLLSYGDAMLII